MNALKNIFVGKLQRNDLQEFSRIAKEIIEGTAYYSSKARKSEVKKFDISALHDELNDDKKIILVAKSDNKILGFCNGKIDEGTFWIDWVGILSKFREKGIATKILKLLEKDLKVLRIHKIWCDSRDNNTPSIALLNKNGFEKIAFLKKHWYQQDFYLWAKFI